MSCHRKFKITLNSIDSSHCSRWSSRLFDGLWTQHFNAFQKFIKCNLNTLRDTTWMGWSKCQCVPVFVKKYFKYPHIPVVHVHSKRRGLFWTSEKNAALFVAIQWSCYAYKLRHVDFSYSSMVSLAILATLFGDLRKWNSTKIKNLLQWNRMLRTIFRNWGVSFQSLCRCHWKIVMKLIIIHQPLITFRNFVVAFSDCPQVCHDI